MLASRRLLISMFCCAVLVLGAGACEQGQPASGKNEASPSLATPTTGAPTKPQTDRGSKRRTRDERATSPKRRERTASDRSGDARQRGQASSGQTAAERRASDEAERLARRGAVREDAPSTNSDHARDSAAQDHWALYQERARKKQRANEKHPE